jgi:hypothetical protein
MAGVAHYDGADALLRQHAGCLHEARLRSDRHHVPALLGEDVLDVHAFRSMSDGATAVIGL